jgi:hypothetical protein
MCGATPPFLPYAFTVHCLMQHRHNFILRTISVPRELNKSYKETCLQQRHKAHTSEKRLPHLRHPFKRTRSACNRKLTSQHWRNSNPALWEEPSNLYFNSGGKDKSKVTQRMKTAKRKVQAVRNSYIYISLMAGYMFRFFRKSHHEAIKILKKYLKKFNLHTTN